MKKVLLFLLIAFIGMKSWGQNYQTFDASTTNAWNASKWTAPSATNACDGGTKASSFTSGNIVYLCTPNGTGSGSMGITIGGIIANENYTHSSNSGTLATGGNVVHINVAAGKILNIGSQNISTAAGTGFIKDGSGAYQTAGGTFTGGFTVNAGVMLIAGVNAMGGGTGNTLTLNGGTIAGVATKDLSSKYPGGITVGGDFQLGEVPSNWANASNTANLTFSNNVSLGSALRTLTLGNSATYTFSGIISNSGSNGITFTANSNGTSGKFLLTGANTYSGPTTVSGGTLQLNNSGGGTLPSANSVTVNSGGTLRISSNQTLNNVTVNSGGTLQIDNGAVFTATGTITIASGGALIVAPGGALIGNSSNVTGTVTLQQSFVGQRGWRVLANPFTTATTIATVASGNNIAISTTPSGASGLTDSRTYDNSANAAVTDWANVTASSWAANTAYALFYRGTNAEVTGNSYTSGPAGQTYSVSGTLNGATTTITPLVGDGTSFNLIGNPYAAPVTTQALTGGVAAPYTVYQISVSGDGRTKNGGWVASLTSSTSNTIPVLGVIAYQPSNTNPVTITAATDINTGGTLQTGLFGAATTIKNLELIVNNSKGEYQDKLFVRIGTDKNRLSKFANDNVNFYTINSKNEHLAIDSREQLNTSIPLGISGAAGSYVLNVANN
ncbi:MAG: autotransporter-associated beta strand repeat-containing protein, partial [Bacteroidetes bacterium]|nr:autotransporter-associated beta strand repeat-containing protein [Bacteroidota bacterium]